MEFQYDPEDIIKLNVGGTIFETKAKTLSETQILPKATKPKSKSKMLFIDRDPNLFKYILDFLRGHSLYLSDDSPLSSIYMQKSLLEEAKFYQIPDLEQALTLRLRSAQPQSNYQLWKTLESIRRKYEEIRKTISPPPDYPEELDLKFHPTNIPTPTKEQIQNQINILESLIQAHQNQKKSSNQSHIEAKIEETKNFLLESVKNLQTLAPHSPFTRNLQEDIDQFYRENRNVFHNLASSNSSPQEIPKLINKLLHFIWAKGLEQTPEGQEEGVSHTPFDVLFGLITNLTNTNQSQDVSGTGEEPTP